MTNTGFNENDVPKKILEHNFVSNFHSYLHVTALIRFYSHICFENESIVIKIV